MSSTIIHSPRIKKTKECSPKPVKKLKQNLGIFVDKYENTIKKSKSQLNLKRTNQNLLSGESDPLIEIIIQTPKIKQRSKSVMKNKGPP